MTPRLAGVTAVAYRMPMPVPWGPIADCQYLIAATVTASDGATGQGFSWAVQAGARAIHAMVTDDCGPAAIGGPTAPAAAWDRMWWRLRESGGGVTTLAMAAIDIGLWDLQAKAAGLSLTDLIGRQREATRVYASGVNKHLSLAELTEQVQRWVEAGHTAVKVKVGLPSLDEDVERVAAVRRVIGPGRRLMIDANQLWDLPTARRAAKVLAPFDIYWLEEPLPAEDVQAYARLRAAIDIPLAAGESLYTEAAVPGCAAGRRRRLPAAQRVPGRRDHPVPAHREAGQNVRRPGHAAPAAGHLRAARTVPAAAGLVEDIDQGSFAALGALAATSGVTISDGELRADTPPGHGLTFAGDRLERVA